MDWPISESKIDFFIFFDGCRDFSHFNNNTFNNNNFNNNTFTFNNNTFNNNTFTFNNNTFNNTLHYKDNGSLGLIQVTLESFFTNSFFLWVLLVLFLNRKNWKRPVIYILIAHWFFKTIATISFNNELIFKVDFTKFYTTEFELTVGLGMVFIFISEIIGDWYTLLRTQAVINNRKKLKVVRVICILFNLTKIFGMLCWFIKFPLIFSSIEEYNIDEYIERIYRLKNSNNIDHFRERIEILVHFNESWSTALLIMQVGSIVYDISIIYSLKKYVFDKTNENKLNYNYSNNNNNKIKNSLLEKFKHMSEYRIIASICTSFIFLPLLIINIVDNIKQKNPDPLYSPYMTVIQLRQVVVDVNYYLMYIDQVLLRFYVERNNPKFNSSFNRKSLLSALYPNKNININSFYQKYNFNNKLDNDSINSINNNNNNNNNNKFNTLPFSQYPLNNNDFNSYNNIIHNKK
ncbi:hypothetical protein BCR32DRAFT_273456 [Anaeromyces robustus]|uniref:Uncharacterized protein n=1 Tax=Anaeromyces robustus TaxID=1754192 RepID=A0A1Y1VQ03_9FUNG|nr:hypothetical protein BCR32DRAFT_273456 [Anaeromyces robustus]|eukprot:ORX63349.1 hypothetical protein BCR32DRAFT_273456 [Anaeromyces robustus]